MAKFLADGALDALLDYIEASDLCTICAGQPADFTAATTNDPTGDKLADVAVDSSDWTKANGDTSGRKSTFAQQTGVTVDVTGTADHIAFTRSADSSLRLVTTCTSQAVTAGNTATINSFKVEVADIA
jgi:hypothetical protein